MRKRRFDPLEKTKSFVFLPPMLNIDPILLQTHLLLNAYLYDENVEDGKEDGLIFLHYEYQDLEGSFGRLENNMKLVSEFKGIYDPDRYTTMFYFDVPYNRMKEYKLFLQSKYSQVSDEYKQRILKFHNFGTKSEVYGVLYKTKERRKVLEETLDVYISEDAEVASLLNIEKETYTKQHLITNPLELNPLIWKT
jgi:hypothetical protein